MGIAKSLRLSPQEEEYVTASEYYWGNQYDHLPAWNQEGLGHREKAPRLRFRLTKLAVGIVKAKLFGESRKPQFHAKVDEIDRGAEALEGDEGADEVATVNTRLADLYTDSGMREELGEVARIGMLQDSVGIAFHYFAPEGEEPSAAHVDFEILNGAGTVPLFGRDDRARAMREGVGFGDLLEIDERWREVVEDPTTLKEREYLHRRKWTTAETIEYHSIPTDEVKDPAQLADMWRVNEDQSVEHGLGFVPAQWIPNGKVANDYRGMPIVGAAERTIEDEINYLMSQTGRAIAYNQDPKIAFTDVANLGGGELRLGPTNSLNLQSRAGDTKQAAVSMLELEGGGQVIAEGFANTLKNFFFELCHVVVHNPEQFAGALSGTAMERLLEPTLDLVDDLRPIYGRRCGLLLSKMYQAVYGEPVQVEAVWGPLVSPTVEDRETAVRTDGGAFEAGYITELTLIEALAPYYNIDNPAAYIRAMRVAEFEEAMTTGTMNQGTEEVDGADDGGTLDGILEEV